jgi:hypothetical protein
MSTYTKLSKLANLPISRSAVFGGLIFMALIAFELFNYSTTEYSLADLIGNLEFMGIRWATILAIAFCGIDFAGIARLFTPEKGRDEPAEVWYLFGAWLLAAGMNAILTWWGVSVAIANHQTSGSAVIPQATLLKIVPVFVALMVWVIRILIIGTFSVAGEHLLWQEDRPRTHRPNTVTAVPGVSKGFNNYKPHTVNAQSRPAAQNRQYTPAPKPPQTDYNNGYSRPEPTYTNASVAARPHSPRSINGSNVRR